MMIYTLIIIQLLHTQTYCAKDVKTRDITLQSQKLLPCISLNIQNIKKKCFKLKLKISMRSIFCVMNQL